MWKILMENSRNKQTRKNLGGGTETSFRKDNTTHQQTSRFANSPKSSGDIRL